MMSNAQTPEQTPTEVAQGYDTLAEVMPFVIQDAYFRILGQQNIHFSILTVLDYWLDDRTKQMFGNYTITTVFDRDGKKVAPWLALRIDGIELGSNYSVSMYFWGQTTGINTVVSRYRFWKLFIASGVRTNLTNRINGTTSTAFIPSQQLGILGTAKGGLSGDLNILKRIRGNQ